MLEDSYNLQHALSSQSTLVLYVHPFVKTISSTQPIRTDAFHVLSFSRFRRTAVLSWVLHFYEFVLFAWLLRSYCTTLTNFSRKKAFYAKFLALVALWLLVPCAVFFATAALNDGAYPTPNICLRQLPATFAAEDVTFRLRIQAKGCRWQSQITIGS